MCSLKYTLQLYWCNFHLKSYLLLEQQEINIVKWLLCCQANDWGKKMFHWDGWVSLPQSWTSSDEWRRLYQHGGSLKTGNSSRFAAWNKYISRYYKFNWTINAKYPKANDRPSDQMKNGSSSNGNETGDGEDCSKHQSSVTVLAIFRFGLVSEEVQVICLICTLLKIQHHPITYKNQRPKVFDQF